MSGIRSPITPPVLAWAIKEDGRSPGELAEKLKVDRSILDQWTDGDSLPTVGQVTKLAEVLRRPRALFFLPRPPAAATLPASFRHPPGDDRLIGAAARRRVRQARRIQSAVALALDDEEPLQVPRFPLGASAARGAAELREWLGVSDTEQSSWDSDYDSVRGWREALDAHGILVFSLEIGRDDVRGFSAWDDHAPLIVMNASSVSPAAPCFTPGHELGHLVTRQDAACIESQEGMPFDVPVERWCEEFSAALLMPELRVRAHARQRGLSGGDADLNDVKALMKAFRVSARASALRLIDLGYATRGLYADVVRIFQPNPRPTTTDIRRPRRQDS
jgi:Zn-dependent peptidase ImmA (M78 family)/transcriptional regulator with XRE-family HTH domain